MGIEVIKKFYHGHLRKSDIKFGEYYGDIDNDKLALRVQGKLLLH